MPVDRRSTIRAAALAAGTALAGCLDVDGGGSPDGSPTGTPGPTGDTAVTAVDTTPLAVGGSLPRWHDDDGDVGRAIVVDDEERQRAVLAMYAPDPDRRAALSSFLEGVDYGAERLLVVASVGPDGCHDALEIGDVGLTDDGRLSATATVRDAGGDDRACTEAIVYPSTLARIAVDGTPPDEATVEVTDGRGETAAVTASSDDPLSPDPADLAGHVRPDADPEPRPPLACERSGVHRHPQVHAESATQWGDFVDEDEDAEDAVTLSLRVDETGHAYGDMLAVRLTNVTDRLVYTGNRAKYTLQTHTGDGWQDVRVAPEDAHFGYTDEAVSHAPGDGFEWRVELTESGLVEDTFHDGAEVCPDLETGRYRFAFFGVAGDGAVAASFDLER